MYQTNFIPLNVINFVTFYKSSALYTFLNQIAWLEVIYLIKFIVLKFFYLSFLVTFSLEKI